MRPTPHRLLTPSTLVLLLAACAGTPAATESPGSSDAPEDSAEKVDELERDLALARERLMIAKLELEAYEPQNAAKVRNASHEIELAEAALEKFSSLDAPNRTAQAELDLRSAKDRAQEAEDELAQIEIMYEGQDLNDVTAEFVVSRGRRNAERAAARIAIQEREHLALVEHELPTEQKRMQLAVDKAAQELANIEREAEIGRRQKAVGVKEAEGEVDRLERELAEAREEARP